MIQIARAQLLFYCLMFLLLGIGLGYIAGTVFPGSIPSTTSNVQLETK